MNILIIEDDVGIATLLLKRLTLQGHKIVCTYTAREALVYLESHLPDLLVLDYSLPDMNGRDFIELIRGGTRPFPHFIVATGHGDERVAVEMMKLGAKDYLVKDSHFLDLLPETVRRLHYELQNDGILLQTQEKLRVSEEQFRTILQTAMDGFWLLDTRGRLLEVNDTYCRMSGYNAQELKSMSVSDIEAHESGSDTATHIQKIQTVGEDRFESKHRRQDGSIFDVEVSVQYQPVDGGRLVAFIRDITQRKIAGEALKLQQYYLERAQEIGSIGTWELDIVANRLYWTQENYRIFGIEPGTILTYETFLECVHPDDRDYVNQEWTASYVTQHYDIEHRLLVQGAVKWVREKADLQFDGKGNCIRAIGVTQDITQRKQAEVQIKQALDEKTTLLQELYHRTKNNMQVIYSLLALRASYLQDKQLQSVLKDVGDKIQAMALVHQKLYESRNLSSIDLKDYIHDLAVQMLKSYQVKPDRIALEVEMDSVIVVIDTAIPCGLVLSELISNALKHAFPKDCTGSIRVQLHRLEDGTITLQVSDNGVGVPANFDFRKSNSLGLQTVWGIVEHQLQGLITVETSGGVCWKIRFKDSLYRSRV